MASSFSKSIIRRLIKLLPANFKIACVLSMIHKCFIHTYTCFIHTSFIHTCNIPILTSFDSLSCLEMPLTKPRKVPRHHRFSDFQWMIFSGPPSLNTLYYHLCNLHTILFWCNFVQLGSPTFFIPRLSVVQNEVNYLFTISRNRFTTRIFARQWLIVK